MTPVTKSARPSPAVHVATPAGSTGVLLEVPEREGPWPAVVVIHDAAGLTRDTQAQCRWLADAGFLAAAPELFDGVSILGCLRTVIRDYATWQGRVFEQVEAVRGWVAGRPDCTGRVGVLGFCMGGGFALSLAPGHGFAAASANYGMIPRDAQRFFVGACPIIASYGGRDRTSGAPPIDCARPLTPRGWTGRCTSTPRPAMGSSTITGPVRSPSCSS